MNAVTITSAPALALQQPERIPQDQMPLVTLVTESPEEQKARADRYLKGAVSGIGKKR